MINLAARALLVLISLTLTNAQTVTARQPDRATLPGRPIKVASLCLGMVRADQTPEQREARERLVLEYLEEAGRKGADIACTTEDFISKKAEPVPGPITRLMAQQAAKHRMYVLCNVRELHEGEPFNSAVLIDREGNIAGRYRKVYPWFGEGSVPGREGVPVFETDFGKIAALTCFDSNFPELWNEADMKGAEVVFWLSGGGGGVWVNAYATLHNYYVFAVGNGQVADKTGEKFTPVDRPRPGLFLATVDLDRTFAHGNFNSAKIKRMLAEHKKEVELERHYKTENWYLLRAIQPGVRVRDLFRQYDIEVLRDYRNRSRRLIEQARRQRKPM